jgi:hypothetical protein
VDPTRPRRARTPPDRRAQTSPSRWARIHPATRREPHPATGREIPPGDTARTPPGRGVLTPLGHTAQSPPGRWARDRGTACFSRGRRGLWSLRVGRRTRVHLPSSRPDEPEADRLGREALSLTGPFWAPEAAETIDKARR